MNKTQIASKVASVSTKSMIVKTIRRYTLAGLAIFLLMFGTMANFRYEYLNQLLKNLSSSISDYSIEKIVNITSHRLIKTMPAEFEPYYVLISPDLNGGEPFVLTVLASHEQAFLRDIQRKKIKLSNSPTTKNTLNIYPPIRISHPLLENHLSNTFNFTLDFLLTNWQTSLLFFLACLLMTPLAGLVLIPRMLKRRVIFLKHFKMEDLSSAKSCVIKRVHSNKTGNVFSLQGNVFQINGSKDNCVIYNNTKLESIKGRYLSYGGHYYFFSEKLVNDLKAKHET